MAYYYKAGVIVPFAQKFYKQMILVVAGLFIASMASMTFSANAETLPVINFESFNAAVNLDGQEGWNSDGAAGSGCAVYDHEIVDGVTTAGFGAKSLRISNAVTSGCFSDHTFSKSLAEAAGESTAQGGTQSSLPVHRSFESSWDFASTVPNAEQPGLSVVASPDRGDGARMSWIQMADTPNGLAVNFYDYQKSVGNFVYTELVANLDRTKVHNIKVTMDFVDGPANDVVKVYIDGVLEHTGTSWEDYFRDVEGNPTRTVDSVLFRTGGASAPANLDKGFLIDNLNLFSGPTLTSKDQCKNGGWANFATPRFKNQGQCVSYIASGGKNIKN